MIFDIIIRSQLSLTDLATTLGNILNSKFTLDESGYFEEFPAFETTKEDYHIAILGQELGVEEDQDIFQMHIQTEDAGFEIEEVVKKLSSEDFEIIENR